MWKTVALSALALSVAVGSAIAQTPPAPAPATHPRKAKPPAPPGKLASAAGPRRHEARRASRHKRRYHVASRRCFAHEADGRQPAQRAEAAGYRYCMVAENLAMNLDSRGFETKALAGAAVEGWKNSPGHRANMLQPTATEIGVAVARAPDPDPKFISVQLFGRPESLKVQFRIENQAGVGVGYRLGEEAHTLAVRSIVTHTSCEPSSLSFATAENGVVQRFTPSSGDLFIVRARAPGALEVERKHLPTIR